MPLSSWFWKQEKEEWQAQRKMFGFLVEPGRSRAAPARWPCSPSVRLVPASLPSTLRYGWLQASAALLSPDSCAADGVNDTPFIFWMNSYHPAKMLIFVASRCASCYQLQKMALPSDGTVLQSQARSTYNESLVRAG